MTATGHLTDAKPTILAVDDEPANLQVLRHILQPSYRLLFARSGASALELARANRPDLILLDIVMPGMSGYEVCTVLKQDPHTVTIPVIFVTALTEAGDEQQGLEMGAVDYIVKPFSPSVVQARIRNHLPSVQVGQLEEAHLQIIRCLGTAAKYKDNETGRHVVRMSHVVKMLALAAGYGEHVANELLHAAPMHDVGKIGIPDAILQKPGRLTEEEWAIMRQHTVIGARILGDHPSGLLRLAATIALYHHEKWDGSGYPQGLTGQAIPHAARIVALADVFDALISVRPYKKAWTAERALNLIRSESGKHFDPDLARLFIDCTPEIVRIYETWADAQQTAGQPLR
ncbi:HD domain-containing phosphohydrolase [Xanthobacter autotrophicus DSM 431]|uniref:response regulator n=1 Tax=Xanthobacter nonsaccharivorans TaxID=3119912 RepID=UPI003728C810